MCTWVASTIYSLTLYLPELVPVRHGHPRPPEGPRPRRGAAASQIRPQSTGTRSGDLRPKQVGECIAHPGLSPGPINRRLRRRAQELVFTRSKCVRKRVKWRLRRRVTSCSSHPALHEHSCHAGWAGPRNAATLLRCRPCCAARPRPPAMSADSPGIVAVSDLLGAILSHLDLSDLSRAALVCHAWAGAVRNDGIVWCAQFQKWTCGAAPAPAEARSAFRRCKLALCARICRPPCSSAVAAAPRAGASAIALGGGIVLVVGGAPIGPQRLRFRPKPHG